VLCSAPNHTRLLLKGLLSFSKSRPSESGVWAGDYFAWEGGNWFVQSHV
jgi:hypothetical protein